MSFLPVAAAPAVPAPAKAPIAAPFPPPAKPPISAPAPAPPPMNTVSRLALLPAVCPARDVETAMVFPFTVTERKRSHNFAGVERRPDGCTLATTSFAAEPFGIINLPPTVTSLETLPLTLCPTFAVFELTDWLVVTLIEVPAGTVVAAESTNGISTRKMRAATIFRESDVISVPSVEIDSGGQLSRNDEFGD